MRFDVYAVLVTSCLLISLGRLVYAEEVAGAKASTAKPASSSGGVEELRQELRKEREVRLQLEESVKKLKTELKSAKSTTTQKRLISYEQARDLVAEAFQFSRAVATHSFTVIKKNRIIGGVIGHESLKPATKIAMDQWNRLASVYHKNMKNRADAVLAKGLTTVHKVCVTLQATYEIHGKPIVTIANKRIDDTLTSVGFYESYPQFKGRVPTTLLDKIMVLVILFVCGFFFAIIPLKLAQCICCRRCKNSTKRKPCPSANSRNNKTYPSGGDSTKPKHS